MRHFYIYYDLINYILPTEDLEDLDIIKSKFDSIEQYEFKEIINKYPNSPRADELKGISKEINKKWKLKKDNEK